MSDPKRDLIQLINSSKDAVNKFNNNNDQEEGYLTYVTPIGWIIGKEFELNIIDTTNEEKMTEEIKKLSDEGKPLDVFSLAVSMYNKLYKDEIKEGINTPIDAIFLEDVIIKGFDGSTTKTNAFVLFSDQVIGVIPGKVKF